jgi:uncharacterized protein YeaO (DUF488 family)
MHALDGSSAQAGFRAEGWERQGVRQPIKKAEAMALRSKRVYEAAAAGDGERILVDRIWPRGLSKACASLDRWMKDVAPSTELRKWFGHRVERWHEFQDRYQGELHSNSAVGELQGLVSDHDVTLLYAARDREHNHVIVLMRFVEAATRSGTG